MCKKNNTEAKFGRIARRCWSHVYLRVQSIVRRLTLFVSPGWQSWSGTPNAPVTAAEADEEDVVGWSVDDRVEPEPCRLNGFTLSFHVAGCDPALLLDTLSRDVWLGGDAPEADVQCSFCFGEPPDSVTQCSNSATVKLPTVVCHLVMVVGLMHRWPGWFVIWRRGANQAQTAW